MVSKRNRKSIKKSERTVLTILILIYILGVISGYLFISDNTENELFAAYLSRKNTYNTTVFFFMAFLLKYSGILGTAVCLLPFLSGINNSVYYYNLFSDAKGLEFKTITDILSNTAIIMLLILYCIVILLQIFNKKYNIRRDIKYFFVYISAVIVIYLLKFTMNIILF